MLNRRFCIVTGFISIILLQLAFYDGGQSSSYSWIPENIPLHNSTIDDVWQSVSQTIVSYTKGLYSEGTAPVTPLNSKTSPKQGEEEEAQLLPPPNSTLGLQLDYEITLDIPPFSPSVECIHPPRRFEEYLHVIPLWRLVGRGITTQNTGYHSIRGGFEMTD